MVGTSVAADSVTQNNHAVVKATFRHEFQVQPHTLWEEPLSAPHDCGADSHLKLIDKAQANRLRGEFRTVNGNVVRAIGFEASDRIAIKLPLDPCPRTARFIERSGVNYLLGRLPLPRQRTVGCSGGYAGPCGPA